MIKNEPNLKDLNEIDITKTNADNLEIIRYKLLEQFCDLMQLNAYIYNFGKYTEILIDKVMQNNTNYLQLQQQPVEKTDPAFLEKFKKSNERNRETLKILHQQQENCWKKNKSCTQNAMLDFNHLSYEIGVMLKKLEHHSLHDPLTQLHNRRYFNSIITYEVSRSERHHHSFCLLSIDLDNFKEINDTYGHFSGDEILRQFAEILRSHLRKSDVIARIGGDEFSILLIETDSKNGEQVAKSLVKSVSETVFKDSQDHIFRISISIGIANYPKDARTVDVLNNCADEALYDAKNAGKNQVANYQSKDRRS